MAILGGYVQWSCPIQIMVAILISVHIIITPIHLLIEASPYHSFVYLLTNHTYM